MAAFTRLVLARGDLRADAVVASDQPLATLMPRFMDVLGLQPGTGPYTLARAIGDVLDMSLDCAENHVADGEILRVVEEAEAPAPPSISDVTGLVADLRGTRTDVWNSSIGRAGACLVTGASVLLAGLRAPWGTVEPILPPVVLCAVLLIVAGAAAGLGRAGRRWPCAILSSAAIGLAVPAGIAMSALIQAADVVAFAALASATLAWVAVGLGTGVGLGWKPPLVAAGVCGTVSLVGCVLLAAGVPVASSWAVIGVVSVVELGLIPSWAMAASGLTGLGDFPVEAALVARDDVVASAQASDRVISWCVIGCSITASASVVILARDGGLWAVILAAVILVLMVLRVRPLPSAYQIGTIWLGAGIGVCAMIWQLLDWWSMGVFLALAVVVAVGATLHMPETLRLRARGWADLAAKFGTAATIPLLLGMFGLYSQLLGAFK